MSPGRRCRRRGAASRHRKSPEWPSVLALGFCACPPSSAHSPPGHTLSKCLSRGCGSPRKEVLYKQKNESQARNFTTPSALYHWLRNLPQSLSSPKGLAGNLDLDHQRNRIGLSPTSRDPQIRNVLDSADHGKILKFRIHSDANLCPSKSISE